MPAAPRRIAQRSTMGHNRIKWVTKWCTMGRTACFHTACSQEPAGRALSCWAPPPLCGSLQIQGLPLRPQCAPPRGGGFRAASAFVGSVVRLACCVGGRCELGRESRPFAGTVLTGRELQDRQTVRIVAHPGFDACVCRSCAESGEGGRCVSASTSTPGPGAFDFRSTSAPTCMNPPRIGPGWEHRLRFTVEY